MYSQKPLVHTVKELCKVCYTCVRECPARAIRISGGQAEVIASRCIGCGNCVRLCSQNAKVVQDDMGQVKEFLDSEKRTAICIAPSFPAEFNLDPSIVPGALKKAGFDIVIEVAFGADLVAREYKTLLEENPDKRFIATTCPAIVAYVEKYYPSMVKNLVKIVSPMVAAGRVIHQKYGNDIKIVFAGPCIAKKAEAEKGGYRDIDVVLTFAELRRLLDDREVPLSSIEPGTFDPPHPGNGMLFPIGGGMLQAANLDEDLMENRIIATDGTKNFVQAIKEFSSGNLNMNLLEVLCCNGCIMGSGITSNSPQFTRRTQISDYSRKKYNSLNKREWEKQIEQFEYLNLSTEFSPGDLRLPIPSKNELKRILENLGKSNPEDQLNCGACGYETCIEHAIAIHKGLAETEMCLPHTIEQLKKTAGELISSYEQLENTQQALVQSEKLASMGQLAAGIAHEVNNPLGVVLMYSHLLKEQTKPESQMARDLDIVIEQTERCKKIIGGLLNFSRKNKIILKPANIHVIIDKIIKLLPLPGNISINKDFFDADIVAEIDSEQIIQVLTNLFSNSIEAMPHGGMLGISTKLMATSFIIKISDTGIGIEKENIKKIFEPFFTTKQIGKGTGLGLAVSYGIIKMHRGRISVTSNNKSEKGPVGTVFEIELPLRSSKESLISEITNNIGVR